MVSKKNPTDPKKGGYVSYSCRLIFNLKKEQGGNILFWTQVLFAISTSIFSTMCKNVYNGMQKYAQWPSSITESFREETYKLNLKY
jgi:hypothetical protein